jgi:DNA-binding transcriptional LysR family regulator
MANRKPDENWDHIRYFLAVARMGTLSAAADQLGTEHATVVRHIQALEDELNTRLFHKSNSGCGLTEGTSALAQLHATLSGSGLCILPAYVASSYPTLVPVLSEQVSVTRSVHMHIHEDHRRAPHVREVATFIAAEVEGNHSLFFAPTAPALLNHSER